MRKIFLFLSFFSFVFVFSQQQKTLKLNQYKVANFSDTLRENSGLTFLNQKLYTINDSGNSSEIFEIHKKNGKILRNFKTPLKNTDWEAISNDGTQFFIGDFGNNSGSRKDLKIYTIAVDSAQSTIVEHAPSENLIRFYYPEQKDFAPKNLATNFDAEAMIVMGEKIHLFTKEWVSRKTTHYVLEAGFSGIQEAQKVEVYPTRFLVTDAAYFAGKLYLIGYTRKTEVYLDIFEESSPGIFFEKPPVRYYLGSALSLGQIEGIEVDENGVYISGEAFHSPFGVKKQSLYFVPKEKF